MKSKLAALVLAATMSLQLGVGAFAQDALSYPEDPETGVGEAAWTILSLPVDLTSAVASGALGAVGGGLKGIVRTEEKFADATYGRVNENPLLLPVGLVGTVVAVPIGFLMGLPSGLVGGVKYGWNMLDEIGN